jgi:hypothetical protein
MKCFGSLPLFLAFAIICVAALLFVRFLVTETKGRSLEEIQNDLRQKTVLGDGQREARLRQSRSFVC